MNIGAILIGLALLVVAIPFVFSPFLRKERRRARSVTAPNEDLERRKTEMLRALGDLDFDFQTGKVVREDYEILRARLVAEAGNLIENVRQEKDEIEKLIRTRRESKQKSVTCAHCGRPLQPQDQFCPGCGAALGKACPKCGRKAGVEDKFCPGCGTQLAE